MTSTVMALLILEIISLFMMHSGNNKLIYFHRIINLLGFSLCPVVSVLLVLFNMKQIQAKRFFMSVLAIPLYLNTVICIGSFHTGWVYYVDQNNLYSRGEWFLLPELISMFYLLLLVIDVFVNRSQYEMEERVILFTIIIIPVLGSMIQISLPKVSILWMSVSMSFVIYYIFLRELQFKYDIQTGIRNRSAFEKEIRILEQEYQSSAIVIVDINNLKNINDHWGHRAGDEIIKQTAKMIETSFIKLGKAFRIGGDEFCVLCKDIPQLQMNQALEQLDQSLRQLNEKRDDHDHIELAYGYSYYHKEKNVTIYSVFDNADKAMYENKARMKRACNI